MFHKHMSSFSYILTIVNYFQLPKDVFKIGNKTMKMFLAQSLKDLTAAIAVEGG